MKNLYLTLAVLGTLGPYAFFVPYTQANGFDLMGFLQAMFANGAAGGISTDLLISSVVFWVWLFHSRAKKTWLFIVLNLFVGLSCALPAYLYARERAGEAAAG